MSSRLKAYEVYQGGPDVDIAADEEILEWQWVAETQRYVVLVVPRASLKASEQ